MNNLKTAAAVRITRYPSNYDVKVSSIEEGIFNGQFYLHIDGLEQEDKDELESDVDQLASLNTVEEVESWLSDNCMNWNCIAYDVR